jgi:WS/DGAT/MGAT family acyltransferase
VALNSAIGLPGKLTALARDTAASALYSSVYDRLKKLNLPPALMRVAHTPINTAITRQRTIEYLSVPLSKVRAIRNHLPHVTTNDILMGICAEALCHFIRVHGDSKPKVPLIALGPISVRSTSLDYKSGNQLAATLFSLATTEEDPVRRIQLIHEAATSSDSYKSAISASRLSELVPSCVAALSARAYSEFLLTQKYKPMFNLPVTNIPGPQFPLYLEDSELLTFISASPLFDGIALALMIISYNGSYHISTTYCPDVLEQQISFNNYLNQAIETILDRVNQQQYGTLEKDEDTAATGLIEDIVGLFGDIFSLSPRKTDREKVVQKQD